eukprot:10229498-Alexandrium_andersonii.AAC.1
MEGSTWAFCTDTCLRSMSARRCLPGALPPEGRGASQRRSTPERSVPMPAHGAMSKSKTYGVCGGLALASVMFGP